MAGLVHQHGLRPVHFEAVITRLQLDLAGMGGFGNHEGVSFRAGERNTQQREYRYALEHLILLAEKFPRV
jgi:hypothetical protein